MFCFLLFLDVDHVHAQNLMKESVQDHALIIAENLCLNLPESDLNPHSVVDLTVIVLLQDDQTVVQDHIPVMFDSISINLICFLQIQIAVCTDSMLPSIVNCSD